MSVSSNLRRLRSERGMTQQQVAEKLGVTRQAVSGYESGRTRPDIDMLERLCGIYETDLEALVSGEDRPQKAVRRVRVAATVTLVLLPVLAAVRSALLWTANRFFNYFPVGTGGLSRDDPVFVTRWRLLDAWELTDGLLPAVSFFAFLLLLILLLPAGGRIRLKTKLFYAAALAAAILLPAVLFGVTDPLYGPVDHLITPMRVVARLLLFLLLHLLIAFIQKRAHRT